jgi:hypothetical protein
MMGLSLVIVSAAFFALPAMASAQEIHLEPAEVFNFSSAGGIAGSRDKSTLPERSHLHLGRQQRTVIDNGEGLSARVVRDRQSEDTCQRGHHAKAAFKGQNGKRHEFNPWSRRSAAGRRRAGRGGRPRSPSETSRTARKNAKVGCRSTAFARKNQKLREHHA